MKINYCIYIICLLAFACTPKKEKQPAKPNIIYILADDLGYGELGSYGQKLIETPNIDQLAQQGMRFTQHYSGAPVCAPARGVLLTGKHTGHAHVRGNDEWRSRGEVWDYRAMIADSTLEGQRPIPENTITIGKLMQQAGYKTGVTGKWGLGAPHTAGIPNKQGFDWFVGYNCQRQAHTYYPVHLYKNENRVYLGNDTVPPSIKLEEGADPYAMESYAKYNLQNYSVEYMYDEMEKFIDDSNDQPFFLYWATPIPHMPLQAPQKWVDYYVNKFGDEEPYLGERSYYPQRYPRATYAAMVSYLDELVGKLVEKLKKDGLYDNTLIIFTSDNGPSYNGGTDSPWFNSGGLFKSEQGWGKGFLHEGGIRVPMIASWPGVIESGTVSNHISAFWDVLPTLCEIGGAQTPEDIDGISFLPELTKQREQKVHAFLYWEFPAYKGQQAVRMGKWKGIRKNIFKGNKEIELYDLENDIQELDDVASSNPDVVQQIAQIMKQEHVPATIDRFKIKELGDFQ